jgi:hypothetical protein
MKRRIPLVLLLTPPVVPGGFLIAGLLVAGCFQTINDGNIGGGPQNSVATSPPGNVGSDLPAPFADADVSQQCEPGSALCYQLCLSPECATQDDAGNVVLPPVLQTPVVLLPEGSTSDDPCADVEARSLQIRQQACAQCHDKGNGGTTLIWNYVLDDQALVTTIAPGLAAPLVIPGNPSASVLLQKIQLGIAGGALGMPPSQALATGDVKAQIAATIVYPTPEDVSLLYAWILNCVPGTDGGAYSPSSYYGGNYGPDGGVGSSAGGGSGAADAGLDSGSGGSTDAGHGPG